MTNLHNKLLLVFLLVGIVVGTVGGSDGVFAVYALIGALIVLCVLVIVGRSNNGGLQAGIPLLYVVTALVGMWIGDYGLAGLDLPWPAYTVDGFEVLR